MKKLIVVAIIVVCLPLAGLFGLVMVVSSLAVGGAGGAGYDVGLRYCLSPPAEKPFDKAQTSGAAALLVVEAKLASGSQRAEQMAMAASIWQTGLTDADLTATASTTVPASTTTTAFSATTTAPAATTTTAVVRSPAGLFAEGPSWGTLSQRVDALDAGAVFAERLKTVPRRPAGDPWPTIRTVLRLPQPATVTAPTAPTKPVKPKPPQGNPTVAQLKAYEAALKAYKVAEASYKTAEAAYTKANAKAQAAEQAAQARQAHEAAVWSEAGALRDQIAAWQTAKGC
jgi:hypothetical protein